jgi:hypothetical protein
VNNESERKQPRRTVRYQARLALQAAGYIYTHSQQHTVSTHTHSNTLLQSTVLTLLNKICLATFYQNKKKYFYEAVPGFWFAGVFWLLAVPHKDLRTSVKHEHKPWVQRLDSNRDRLKMDGRATTSMYSVQASHVGLESDTRRASLYRAIGHCTALSLSCQIHRELGLQDATTCTKHLYLQLQLQLLIFLKKKKKKLHGLSPRANYTDRATATCRRSDCQLLRIEGATWSAWRIPTAVFSVF